MPTESHRVKPTFTARRPSVWSGAWHLVARARRAIEAHPPRRRVDGPGPSMAFHLTAAHPPSLPRAAAPGLPLGTVGLGPAACGGGSQRPQAESAAANVTAIGVNSSLWRASLETLSFTPLV